MDTTGAVTQGGTDQSQLNEIGDDRGDFLCDVRAACERFMQDWVAAERAIGGSAGTLPAAAAQHRAATRRFLDAQRALLARRAQLDADVAAAGLSARRDAAATVADARTRAGLPAVSEEFPRGPDGVDGLTISWFDAESELGSVLDRWWNFDGAACDAVMADADEQAGVVRQLARIEAGEVMANWSVPSALPAPSATHMPLLPPTLLTVLERSAETPVEEVCDELLQSLGVASDELATTDGERVETFAPPSGRPLVGSIPTGVFPAPRADSLIGDAGDPSPGVPSRSAGPGAGESSGPDDFDRFWQYPDRHRSSSSRLLRQVVLSMMATTASLAIVLAWIG